MLIRIATAKAVTMLSRPSVRATVTKPLLVSLTITILIITTIAIIIILIIVIVLIIIII